MTAPAFRHDRPGTPASSWDAVLAGLPELALPVLPGGPGRLVVVGAHPDDETLGAGGLVRVAADAGWRVEVVSATAGEGSHPGSATHTPDRLAALRREELRAAVRLLAPDATATCLGLPDGAVADHVEEVVAALVATIGEDGPRTWVCAPWRRDGHPDHDAAGLAAAVAARRTDATLVEYPVWAWHWGTEDDLPRQQAHLVRLTGDQRAAKRAAIAAHASQVAPLGDDPGDEVLLGPDLLAHFERDVEVLLLDDEPVADDALEQVHRERPDPWESTSHYERRKRAVTLACLPRERYASALEVGCSTGALAADLAERCDHLLAVDSSPTALAAARERLGALDHVEVRRAAVPDEWPDGRRDLVVISEVGYFLSPHELARVVGLSLAALAEDGQLLLCHWRHQPEGWPLDGPRVHAAYLATGARVLVTHEEPDFSLHVLARPS